MSDILCMYYSRSGNTRKAVQEIGEALEAEVVELQDGVERGGWRGWLRCGVDAMRRTTRPLSPYETERPLSSYQLVILGTPVWAGRCSSVMRSFLKAHGKELANAAYVVTRSSDGRFQEVYDQMDMYVPAGHKAAVSLRIGSVGYDFWREDFLREVRAFLAEAR